MTEVTQMNNVFDFSLEKECINEILLAIGIWQDNRFVYANKSANELFETNSEEMQEEEFWTKLVHHEDLSKISQKFAEKITGTSNKSSRYNHRIITKSGKVKYLETYIKPCKYNSRLALLITAMEIRHQTPTLEITSSFAAKLHVAEMVLNSLKISYRLVNTHTANLYRRHQEKHEDQILRKHWRQKFQELGKEKGFE
ncbi:hypothetical protein LCGC14_1648800 [marine sediment metagenome]|uniref:PAS fold-3 domain-containing protein n=1 Tax=marine sediment metagenome TaxID=412755 RepID=A0A0F9HYB8_9ZZZZ